MKIPDWVRIIILLCLIGFLSYHLYPRFDSLLSGSGTKMDFLVFLIWLALILGLIFPEVSLFGVIKLRREINSLKTDFKEQVLNLRTEIQNINIRTQASTETHIHNYPPYTDSDQLGPAEPKLQKPTSAPANEEEGPETSKKIEKLELVQLTLGAIKVLSTLWKHQQQYDPKRWSFILGPLSPHYSEFALGVGQLMLLGLAVPAANGQIILTDVGIEYCEKHQEQFFPDWDYHRWGKGAPPSSRNSLNYVGLHKTPKHRLYRIHYEEDAKVAEAEGPLEEGGVYITAKVAVGDASLNKDQAIANLKERLDGMDDT